MTFSVWGFGFRAQGSGALFFCFLFSGFRPTLSDFDCGTTAVLKVWIRDRPLPRDMTILENLLQS